MVIWVGRSICCSSVWSPTPSHTEPFQIKWEVYFSKNCVAHHYGVVVMTLHVDVSALCVCMVSHSCDYTTRVPSLLPYERGLKRQALCQWWESENCSGSKNSQQNFTKQGYMLSFKGGTLLLREMVTMLRSRNVIHRGPVSFWCMIHILGNYSFTKEKGITFWLTFI